MEEAETGKEEKPPGTPVKQEPAPAEKAQETASKKKCKKPRQVRIPENELTELKEKAALADQYLDRLIRLQADFENFRKRKERERLEVIRYATEALLCELVPVLANFDTALTAAEKTPQVKPFADGMDIILRQVKKVLKEHGMEEICPLNAPFDPHRHEAVEKVVTTEHLEGHVLEVLQPGYALNGRVLRPAAVKVAAQPPPSAAAEQTEAASPDSEKQAEKTEEKNETETSQDKIEEGLKDG